jgi:hypothetical protein
MDRKHAVAKINVASSGGIDKSHLVIQASPPNPLSKGEGELLNYIWN